MNETIAFFKHLIEVAEEYNINISTISIEVQEGWSVELTVRRDSAVRQDS